MQGFVNDVRMPSQQIRTTIYSTMARILVYGRKVKLHRLANDGVDAVATYRNIKPLENES